MKKIFVNNTAATSGGALSILKQFLKEVASVDVQNQYYIFCNTDLSEHNAPNIEIINLMQPKSMLVRLKWDYFGMKKWSKHNNINPDLIISLQNTAVYGFKNIPQIIYLHQSIPFYFEHRWSIRKNKQLWFYKNIYKWLIVYGSKNKTVIVQTNWFAKRAKKILKQAKEIIVLKPNGVDIDVSQYESKLSSEKKCVLFYPTSAAFYKNYQVLIDVMQTLENEQFELRLTLSKEQLEQVDINNISSNVTFLGQLSYTETIKQIAQADALVFPSYIETLGLPLLEATAFEKKILTVDLEYAKEVLSGYNKVAFLNPYSVDEWKDAIINLDNMLKEKENTFEYKNEWSKFVDLISNKLNC